MRASRAFRPNAGFKPLTGFAFVFENRVYSRSVMAVFPVYAGILDLGVCFVKVIMLTIFLPILSYLGRCHETF